MQGGKLLRRCLRCVVVLSSTQPQATGQFVDILGGMLSAGAGQGGTTGPLCETLAALGSIKPDVLALLVPDICHTAHVLSSSPSLSSNPDQSQTLVLLNTLLLQTLRGKNVLVKRGQKYLKGTKRVKVDKSIKGDNSIQRGGGQKN